jgi:hypothetical protein
VPFDMWGYTFDGPYSSLEQLQNQGGVYVVWSRRGGRWLVLDVGESGAVRDRLVSHERADRWRQFCGGGTVYYAATYTPGGTEADRAVIEQFIRSVAKPPCGDR